MDFLENDIKNQRIKSLYPVVKRKIGELLNIKTDNVDDNLLAYSLLLFENHHTKSKIKEDLESFFSKDTAGVFVDWLWKLLCPTEKKVENGKNQNIDIIGNKNKIKSKNAKLKDNMKNKYNKSKINNKKNLIDQNKSIRLKLSNDKSKKLLNKKIYKKQSHLLKNTINLKNKNKSVTEKNKKSFQNKFVKLVREKLAENRQMDKNDVNDLNNEKDNKNERNNEIDIKLTKDKKDSFNKLSGKSKDEKIEMEDEKLEENKSISKNVLKPYNSKIKCVFWPNCLKPNCPFYHPTKSINKKLCSYFPNCARGSKCIFLHVDPSISLSKTSNLLPKSQIKCLFSTKCTNSLCQFAHPKINIPCKFKGACYKMNCRFSHSDVRMNDNKNIDENIIIETKKRCAFDKNCQKIQCEFWHPEREEETKNLIEKNKKSQNNNEKEGKTSNK